MLVSSVNPCGLILCQRQPLTHIEGLKDGCECYRVGMKTCAACLIKYVINANQLDELLCITVRCTKWSTPTLVASPSEGRYAGLRANSVTCVIGLSIVLYSSTS